MYIIKESIYDLDSKFKYFNKEFFDDLLPITKVSFEKLSSKEAGAFFLKSKKIVISAELIGKPEVYIDHILIHEMIHYYNTIFNLDSGKQAHGLAFKAKTDEINKKTNNKYKLTLTNVSMALEYDEREEKILYVLAPHIGTTVSATSISASLQFFTEENFNSSYVDNLVKSYQNFADAKRFSIIKTTMNNNYISEDWIGKDLNITRTPFWPVQKDKYFFKMMKQSKDYKVIGHYNFNTKRFDKA